MNGAKTMLTKSLELAIGCVLCLSGLIHFSNPYFFLESVLRYDLLPQTLAPAIVAGLVGLNLFVGASLVLGVLRSGALLTAALLFFVFTVAQFTAYWRDMPIGCGCFGIDESPISVWTMLRSAGLLAASLLCLAWGNSGPQYAGEGRQA